MAKYEKGIYNAANWPIVHTVTSTDQTDGYVTIDFQLADRDVVWNVMCLASNGAVIAMTGALITEPADGQIKIANGGAFTLTAGYILHIQGMSYDSTATYEDV